MLEVQGQRELVTLQGKYSRCGGNTLSTLVGRAGAGRASWL